MISAAARLEGTRSIDDDAIDASSAEPGRTRTAAGASSMRDAVSSLEPFPGFAHAHRAAPLADHQLDVVQQDQGGSNACGTSSLAAVLSYWGPPTNHEEIDASIRHFDLFTAPDAIVAYARDNGMRSELKAGANLEDLASMVDQGVPPIVIIDPDDSDNLNLHYVTVSGYQRDDQGHVSSLVIADSGTNTTYVTDAKEFQKKWGQLKLGGVGTGLNNVMISVVPADGREIHGADGNTRRASDIALPQSSLSSTVESLFARGVASAASGVTTAADAVWQGVQAAGNAIANAWESVKGFWNSIFG